MGAKSPVMVSEMAVGGFNGDDLGKELGYLLREQRRKEVSDRERELNIYRSGSAPPTVEGSMNAIGFLNEDELRSDPAYLSYYYSNVNLNPRLPPPVLSKEDWRSTQRLGGIGDRRKSGGPPAGGSLFSRQPGFEKEENGGAEWVSGAGDGLIGLSLARQKSFAEIFQDDAGQQTSGPDYSSSPASHSALDGGETLSSSETHHVLHHDIASSRAQVGGNVQNMTGLKNKASQTFASVLASSHSMNTAHDAQQLARAPISSLQSMGMHRGVNDTKVNGSHTFNGATTNVVKTDDLVAALSSMKLSSASAVDSDSISLPQRQHDMDAQRNFYLNLRSAQNSVKQCTFRDAFEPGHSTVPNTAQSSFLDLSRNNLGFADFNNSILRSNAPAELHRPTVSYNSHSKAPLTRSVGSPVSSSAYYQKTDNTSYGLSGYPINPALPQMVANHVGVGNLPPLFENAAAASAFAALGLDSRALGGGFSPGRSINGSSELQSPNRLGNHSTSSAAAASALQMQLIDPHYIQCLRTAEYAAQAASNLSDPAMERNFMGSSYADLLGMQEAFLGGLLQPQKQYGTPFLGKTGSSSPGYYGNTALGLNMSYPGSPLASPIPASPVGPGSPMRHAERNMRFHPCLSNFAGGVIGSWNPGLNGNLEDGFPSTLLDEFKSSKTRCFELSDIAGHVVEFSADQYGSRFIQQKLETATTEEKDMVFEEIMPQALSLMTDVFGNYVVQKFFEHGSGTQIRELANQLDGHVLALSLQMYGCRVIQKAIEVVTLDQQTKMVSELDGHIMRCVRDQNGNHVIQKCVECIPQEAIHFIISSFYDHVVTLSTHPYGCRVIQRVLEHCDDPKTQQIVMDEIMQCVCMLAQDQYGNYVVQHVLEHGKPHERSAIIKELAGQIVQMSQQKFASNVVEKCLTFGGPVERQILVNEMLGTTDENEPLQAMMKDQFANYVVQKVLETCDDQQRELILSRIKVHLNALKKYTYGKHIVARVEKLVAAGERRIGLQPSYPS